MSERRNPSQTQPWLPCSLGAHSLAHGSSQDSSWQTKRLPPSVGHAAPLSVRFLLLAALGFDHQTDTVRQQAQQISPLPVVVDPLGNQTDQLGELHEGLPELICCGANLQMGHNLLKPLHQPAPHPIPAKMLSDHCCLRTWVRYSPIRRQYPI